jgi:hypothetical protein
MKKWQFLIGVMLTVVSTSTWAWFGWFSNYTDEAKVRDLMQATYWLIESGVDIYATAGKEVAEQRLLENISPELRQDVDLNLLVNAIDNHREFIGGGVSQYSVEGVAGLFEGSAGVEYRAEIDGNIYEFWTAKVKNKTKEYQIMDLSFLMVKVVNGTEKRVILHQSNHFFEKFEVAPGRMLRLPLDNKEMLRTLNVTDERYWPYYEGTYLENIRIEEVNGKWQYVKVDLELEKLEKREKQLIDIGAVAGYLVIEGLKDYEKARKRGIDRKIKEFDLVQDVEIKMDSQKEDIGRVLSIKGQGLICDVYLLYQNSIDGSKYQYWGVRVYERGIVNPMEISGYMLTSTDRSSTARNLLLKSLEPITTYITQLVTVIEFPSVDKALLD